jgi:hypothetical protein
LSKVLLVSDEERKKERRARGKRGEGVKEEKALTQQVRNGAAR